MPSLLPDTFLENTTHLYLPKVLVKTRRIYGLILGSVVAFFSSAFWITIDVSFSAPGVTRSLAERTELRALVSGQVQHVVVRENQQVKAGQVLLEINQDALTEKLQAVQAQIKEREIWMADLLWLTKQDTLGLKATSPALRSPLYTQQYWQLRAQWLENRVKMNRMAKELRADRFLHKERVIATRELDAKQADYDQLVEQEQFILTRQFSQWQTELANQKLELAQLKSQVVQVNQDQKLHQILAPIDGTLQQWVGKYDGSFVQAGELLGVLSPDSTLVVECYVRPSDMGLLQVKQQVMLQLDALNYREWGLAQAEVLDISQDFTLQGEPPSPVFKVKCALKTTSLQLKNGYKAPLQKGMTFQARFVVAKRTLIQLLFDQLDDWLNPTLRSAKS